MAAAIALSERGMGQTGNNPSVGCVIVKNQRVIGRGWTQPGGRPHAEAMALAQAGEGAKGATIYVSLEPCAHKSVRGGACADAVIAAAPARLVGAVTDPDPRTAGQGYERIERAGVAVVRGINESEARRALAGFITRIEKGRPHVTLKLATSLDGCIALANGQSRWITGDASRVHAHIERSRCDAILVGGGTLRVDDPLLNVRLPGLEHRSPRRIVLSRSSAPIGWEHINTPDAINTLECNTLLVEGGAQTASAFLQAHLVDRLMIYRAPIVIGGGLPCLADLGLTELSEAHGRWNRIDERRLGNDRLDVYEAATR